MGVPPGVALGASLDLCIYKEARNMNMGCNSSCFGRAVAVRQSNISRSCTMNAFLQHINRIIHHSMPIILKLPSQRYYSAKACEIQQTLPRTSTRLPTC